MSGIEVEDSCVTLHELLKRAALAYPKKSAIIYKDRRITYLELEEITTRLANSFLDLGIRKGDRVGILLPRVPEMVISYLALSKCGAISFSISYESPPEEIGRILSDTRPSALIVHSTYLEFLDRINPDLFPKVSATGFLSASKVMIKEPGTTYLVVVGDASRDRTYSFQDLVEKGEGHPCSVSVEPQDIFYLNFTSGTTGAPKGAVTTYEDMFYNTLGAVDALGLTAGDVHMCMFAVYGHPHEIFSRPLFLGGTLVLLGTIYPRSMAQAIEENSVTCMMALPPFYEMLVEVPEIRNFDLSSLRIAESGGMHTHEDLKGRFMEKVGIRITAVWGSTETTGIAIANKWGKVHKKDSIGTPCKYYDVRVVDDKGRELPPGEVGELTFKGPGVVGGYYDKQCEDNNFKADGSYLSGDLGMRDDEGYFFFLGRKSGMLKVGGWKVYPLEIEIVLSSHSGIREVAVIGVDDRKRGEVPKALIVLEEGVGLTKHDIVNFCRGRLTRYKIPRIVQFVQELPKLPSGKLNREALVNK